MKEFKKYIYVFLITCGIFACAWYASTYFNNRKLAEIRDVQDQVTADIMSSETQFDLLEELSCQDIGNNFLSQEISELAGKISYGEQHFSAQSQLALLKEQYTILEVKDFLLTKRISERCKTEVSTILYFYGPSISCTDCEKQGYVLDALRQKYPSVRVYSFDSTLDTGTVHALKAIYKIGDIAPKLVIDGKTYPGFMTLDEISTALPKSITEPVTDKESGNASKSKAATKQ
jgi:hypothetical protein